MQGPQHAQFNIFFGILLSLIFIGILGFGPQYLLIIPISWFNSSLPDIDQATTIPKRWRKLKFILGVLVLSIFIVSIVISCYYGYNIFTQKLDFEDNIQTFSISFGIVCFYLLCFKYLQGKEGKFLTAHRGFTHILIIPIILVLAFIQLDKISNGSGLEQHQIIIINIIKVLIAGLFTGITGHIFLDLTCKAGIKLFWPIYRGKISIGNAITSDPKNPRQAHKSSIITTYFWCLVCIILSIIIIWYYRTNFLSILGMSTINQFYKIFK